MVNFRRTSQAPPFLQGRGRRRLLGIIISSGLLLIVVQMFFSTMKAPPEPTATADPVDNAYRPSEAGGDLIAIDQDAPDLGEEEDETQFPGVDRSKLQGVVDMATLRYAEQDAFFHLFEVLGETTPAEMRAHLKEHDRDFPVGFRQLYQQPRQYRGRVVRIKGTARRVFERPLRTKRAGIDKYYQIWISMPDNQSVMVIYTMELPEGLPLSKVDQDGIPEPMAEPVEVVGIFYKLWLHEALEGLVSTPLVMARTVDWKPEIVEERPPPNLAVIIALMLGGLAGSLVLGATAFMVVSWRSRVQARRRAAEVHEQAIVALAHIEEDPDLGEQLAQIARSMPTTQFFWEQAEESAADEPFDQGEEQQPEQAESDEPAADEPAASDEEEPESAASTATADETESEEPAASGDTCDSNGNPESEPDTQTEQSRAHDSA